MPGSRHARASRCSSRKIRKEAKGLVHRSGISEGAGDIWVEKNEIRPGGRSAEVFPTNTSGDRREAVFRPEVVAGFPTESPRTHGVLDVLTFGR